MEYELFAHKEIRSWLNFQVAINTGSHTMMWYSQTGVGTDGIVAIWRTFFEFELAGSGVEARCRLGCPSKLVLIQNNRN